MKEHEVRKAIMSRKDLTDGDKVVMLAILLTVDWETWTNPTSLKAIANLTGKKRPNIVRHFKKLEQLKLISRDWFTSQVCKAPIMKVHLENIKQPVINTITPPVINTITPCYQDDNTSCYQDDNTPVINLRTHAVINSITLTTNFNNQSIYQSNINMYGLNVGELWGDELREEVEENLKAKKEGDK
jgi:hypothetical protein